MVSVSNPMARGAELSEEGGSGLSKTRTNATVKQLQAEMGLLMPSLRSSRVTRLDRGKKRLGSGKKWLGSRKSWLDSGKKRLGSGKKWLGSGKKWLGSGKSWLDNDKKCLG